VPQDKVILSFAEYVQTAAGALRKQMTFLSPALKYVREQKHEISIVKFLEELKSFYNDKLEKSSISLIIVEAGSDFSVRMNQGKLTQILDNLIVNSEYWLKEIIARRKINEGSIFIEYSKPFLRVYDDGPGIDASVAHSLFEPFVSAKNKGRGLGLFIIKQLLDSEGCSIGMLPDRNGSGRPFKFQIDLRGCLYE
jgi:C4-dicarboxylate-specific signal transduction histidine kinase